LSVGRLKTDEKHAAAVMRNTYHIDPTTKQQNDNIMGPKYTHTKSKQK